MGMGSYSLDNRAARSEAEGYSSRSLREIFSQRNINRAMNPNGVKLRESRDSEEHPESVAIILGLDVTGSMGSIPYHLVQEGLPKIMGRIIQSGTKDPQLMFLALGDHEYDQSPLQVGQFESSDELLDKWLTNVYLEGGGGGNTGESYLLAWYFAAFHTSTDCFEKRKKKGFLFTIGDEPTLPDIPANDLRIIMGDGQYASYQAATLLDKARESYHVYHLHIKQTYAGNMQETMDGWKQLLGDHLIILENHEEVSTVIPEIIADVIHADVTHSDIAHGGSATSSTSSIPKTEIIL
ncbi:von Willebrand factor type A domain-containing protein [Candidatus Electrothrix laxa]